MSKVLFGRSPLVLDRNLAKIIGLNEAIILQQVHYWIGRNKEVGRNFHEGKHWTYNTEEEWNEKFPFWNKDTIKIIFKKLRDMELIRVGNFKLSQMDRTLWYTISYEKLEELVTENQEAILNKSIDANTTSHNLQNTPINQKSVDNLIPIQESQFIKDRRIDY